jgi:hypothetical protein
MTAAYTNSIPCPLRINTAAGPVTGLLFKAPAWKSPAGNHPSGVTIRGCVSGTPSDVCAPIATVQFPANTSMYSTIFVRFDVTAMYYRDVPAFANVREDSRAAFDAYFPQVALIHDLVGVPPTRWTYIEIQALSPGSLVVTPFVACFGRYYSQLDYGNPALLWEGSATTSFTPFTYTPAQLPATFPAALVPPAYNLSSSFPLFPFISAENWDETALTITFTVLGTNYLVDAQLQNFNNGIVVNTSRCLSTLTSPLCTITFTQPTLGTNWDSINVLYMRIAKSSRLVRIEATTQYQGATAPAIFPPTRCASPYQFLASGTCYASIPCTNPFQYTSANITATSNRVCSTATNCTNHREYELAPYTTFSDTKCVNVTRCNFDTSYMVSNYTRYADTKCALISPSCPPGTTFVSNSTQYSDIVCAEVVEDDPNTEGILVGSIIGGVFGLIVVILVVFVVKRNCNAYSPLSSSG